MNGDNWSPAGCGDGQGSFLKTLFFKGTLMFFETEGNACHLESLERNAACHSVKFCLKFKSV